MARPKGRNNKIRMSFSIKSDVNKIIIDFADEKLISMSEAVEILVRKGYKKLQEDGNENEEE